MRRDVLHANKNGALLGIRCEPCFHLGLYRVEVSKTKCLLLCSGGGGGGGALCPKPKNNESFTCLGAQCYNKRC